MCRSTSLPSSTENISDHFREAVDTRLDYRKTSPIMGLALSNNRTTTNYSALIPWATVWPKQKKKKRKHQIIKWIKRYPSTFPSFPIIPRT
ncbi:hypothetical protein CEXT_669701 [Caerostris extrusa]|uniref:Uncharacterized protein n=1 Tax=Caerostris extrusa TaxID=172846 RepID=A0AAV4MUU3_CAEEX|nr:hypothetical protein CEXT_669701 [Caerostris extrusa]